jgi:hypothetical protein
MRAFFAGTDIQIETAARINECTEVEYQAFVMSIGSNIACAFQGGTITITTPDGTPHDATPAAGIPCLGGTAAPCVSGQNGPVDSTRVMYVINELDTNPDGLVLADAEYNGELLHTDDDDTPEQPNATSAFPLDVVLCPTDDPCITDKCETGPDGTGVCIPQPNSTPCPDTDGNECTDAGCDGEGVCDQNHILPDSRPCTDEGNECAVAGCDGAGNCDQLHVPEPNSTPCEDTDGNVCTEAGCDGLGACDQKHVTPDSTPCPDTGNECAVAGCDGAGNCDQLHVPEGDSTPCEDTDKNECTEAGCDGLGACDQNHVLPDSKPCADTGNECAAAGCDGKGTCDQLHVPEPNSTPCEDTDDNVCTIAGCDGQGVCDQAHVTPDSTPCGAGDNECAKPGCDGNGKCDPLHVPAPNSTPCKDTDENVCTEAGCDGLGACDQKHVTPDSTPCPDTGNDCAVAGCDGAGNCDQLHVPESNSTPCKDTDGNECTDAGCDGLGSCDQKHVLPDSRPCTDLGNDCAVAGCDGNGGCDQLHVPEQDSTPCKDTDGKACTEAGCDGLGNCDQLHVEQCQVGICRTPGFWGSHAFENPDKPRSQNITQQVLDAGGGLEICGECITTTVPVKDASSAVEAMCASPSGNILLQNARQLTALGLNCSVSGFGGDCSGDPFLAELMADCNAACVGKASTRSKNRLLQQWWWLRSENRRVCPAGEQLPSAASGQRGSEVGLPASRTGRQLNAVSHREKARLHGDWFRSVKMQRRYLRRRLEAGS